MRRFFFNSKFQNTQNVSSAYCWFFQCSPLPIDRSEWTRQPVAGPPFQVGVSLPTGNRQQGPLFTWGSFSPLATGSRVLFSGGGQSPHRQPVAGSPFQVGVSQSPHWRPVAGSPFMAGSIPPPHTSTTIRSRVCFADAPLPPLLPQTISRVSFLGTLSPTHIQGAYCIDHIQYKIQCIQGFFIFLLNLQVNLLYKITFYIFFQLICN